MFFFIAVYDVLPSEYYISYAYHWKEDILFFQLSLAASLYIHNNKHYLRSISGNFLQIHDYVLFCLFCLSYII